MQNWALQMKRARPGDVPTYRNPCKALLGSLDVPNGARSIHGYWRPCAHWCAVEDQHVTAHKSRWRWPLIVIPGSLSTYGSRSTRRTREWKPAMPFIRYYIFPISLCKMHATCARVRVVRSAAVEIFRSPAIVRGDTAPLLVHAHQPCAAEQSPRLSERTRAIRARRSCGPRNSD